jgi:hypothetical protein
MACIKLGQMPPKTHINEKQNTLSCIRFSHDYTCRHGAQNSEKIMSELLYYHINPRHSCNPNTRTHATTTSATYVVISHASATSTPMLGLREVESSPRNQTVSLSARCPEGGRCSPSYMHVSTEASPAQSGCSVHARLSGPPSNGVATARGVLEQLLALAYA